MWQSPGDTAVAPYIEYTQKVLAEALERVAKVEAEFVRPKKEATNQEDVVYDIEWLFSDDIEDLSFGASGEFPSRDGQENDNDLKHLPAVEFQKNGDATSGVERVLTDDGRVDVLRNLASQKLASDVQDSGKGHVSSLSSEEDRVAEMIASCLKLSRS